MDQDTILLSLAQAAAAAKAAKKEQAKRNRAERKRRRACRRPPEYGQGRCVPMTTTQKHAVMDAAHATNEKYKQPGQHIGPLTRTTLIVLATLLWRFHNNVTGKCFPGYDRLARAANCDVSSVERAIMVLREYGLLDWTTRLVRRRRDKDDPRSPIVPRWTTNQYWFRAWTYADAEAAAKAKPKPNAQVTQNELETESRVYSILMPSFGERMKRALASLRQTVEETTAK